MIATAGLVVLGGACGCWALAADGSLEGGRVEQLLYPATVGLVCAALAAALISQPLRRPRGAAALALSAAAALGLWALASLLWAPDADAALLAAAAPVGAAAAFGLGLRLGAGLGGRAMRGVLPILVAGEVAAPVTLLAIWIGTDVFAYLESDGTLEYPIGYRGANAIFFGIVFLAAVARVVDRRLDWRLRGALLGLAALSLQLAFLCQSRAWLPAMLAGIAVLIALHPRRLRLVGWMALAVIPTLPALPVLNAIFGDPEELESVLLPLLHDAAWATAAATLAATLLGAVAARLEPRIEPTPDQRRRLVRAAGAATVLAGTAAAAAFVVAVGNPLDFVGDRVTEVVEGGSKEEYGAVRITSGGESNRSDFWRVAWEDGKEAPLLGSGAGGFFDSYQRDGRSDENPTDPHSIELTMLSELGLPGMVLLLVFLGAVGRSLWESRRAGPQATGLVAAAAAIGATWLLIASVDRAWLFPPITVLVMALLGAAVAPAAFLRERRRGGGDPR